RRWRATSDRSPSRTPALSLLEEEIELESHAEDCCSEPPADVFVERRGATLVKRLDLLQEFDLLRNEARVLEHREAKPHIPWDREIRVVFDRLAFAFEVVE